MIDENDNWKDSIILESIVGFQTYCRTVVDRDEEVKQIHGLFPLDTICLYEELDKSPNNKESVLRVFCDFFDIMYTRLHFTLAREQYEDCELIRKTIAIEKEICIAYFERMFDEELIAAINTAEGKFKRYYKI